MNSFGLQRTIVDLGKSARHRAWRRDAEFKSKKFDIQYDERGFSIFVSSSADRLADTLRDERNSRPFDVTYSASEADGLLLEGKV